MERERATVAAATAERAWTVTRPHARLWHHVPVLASRPLSLPLRPLTGLPDPNIHPPTVAASGDPFTGLRIAHLVARLPRGQRIRIRDVVDRLNAEYVDWSFSRAVVVDLVVQLQANWMADYRNSSGIVVEEGPAGAEVEIEDSARVDPWIGRQVERLAAECRRVLGAFARDEGATP